MSQPDSVILQSIKKVMDEQTRLIVEDEACKAAARVAERVREMAGRVCAKLATSISYHQEMREIRIHLQIDKLD